MVVDLSKILRWRELARSFGKAHGIDGELVLAVIAQESSGNPYAIRPEPGFFQRYLPGLRRLVSHSVSKRDDRWFQYPHVFACSYGLMQVMYPVALERGLDLAYPTELCDPKIGLEAGCRHLAFLATRVLGEDGRRHPDALADPRALRTVLLLYNGGGDPNYPDRILNWRDRLNGAAAPTAA